ncbi:MAG TPA: lysylphosphatidylglycerol synthase transmembrane domain-containing protein [Gemmatimonadales bacterium]|nr:lysylphosphatidylglycerol synthase transmembrane domain-containing protein [Gemmatimonadales bacterium]
MSRKVRLILFLIGAAIVALMVWKADPRHLWDGLRGSLWVAAALIPLWVAVYALNAVAWRQLTSAGGAPIHFWHAFRMTVMAFAVNYSTPFLSFGGEPLKVVAATPALGRRRAVGSIVAYRLLHALVHSLWFLVALIPAAFLLPATPVTLAGILVVAAVMVLITIFLLSRHRQGLALHLLHGLQRIPLLRRFAARLEHHTEALHEIDRHVTEVYTSAPRRFYGALVLEMTGRLLTLAEFWVILYGLGLGVDPWRALVVASFSSLVINALLFVPFELGTKEGGLYFVFAWLGIDPALGLAAALLSRIRELTFIVVGWALVWTVE